MLVRRDLDASSLGRAGGAWVPPAFLALVLIVIVVIAALDQRHGRGPDSLSSLTQPDAWWTEAVLAALVGGAFYVFYWARRRQTRAFTLVGGLVLGVIALVMGLSAYLPCRDETISLFGPLTWTLALFFGSQQDVWSTGACQGTRPLAASIAQFAALLASTVGFFAVLVDATRDQFDRLHARLARSVVVVAGLDDVTTPVIAALRVKAPGDTIVVVEPDATHPGAGRVRALGARVVTGDLSEPATARSLLLRGSRLKARAVYLVSPDRSFNEQRLNTLVNRLRPESRLKPRLDGVASRVIVRVDDPWQVEDYRRTAVDARYRPWVFEAVSIHETTAAAVVDRLTAAGTERLLVVASSPLTLALLAELARRERELASAQELGLPPEVIGPPLPARVVVLAPDAKDVLRDHQDQQERFGNHGMSTPEAAVGNLEAHEVASIVGDDRWHVVVAAEPSTESALLGARLATRHPTCEVDVLSDRAARTPAMSVDQRPYLFSLTLIKPDGKLSDDTWERVARLLHEHHRLTFPAAATEAQAPSRRPWEHLPAFYRESGLRQIRAVMEAVTNQKRSWGPVADSRGEEGFTTHEIKAISEAEHTSWKEYYTQNGWRLLPEGQVRRSATDRRHRMLRDWHALLDPERERTYGGVQRTVQLLRLLGYRPVRQREDSGGP